MRRIIGAAGAFFLLLTGLVLTPSAATAAGPTTPTTARLTVNPTVALPGDLVQFTLDVAAQDGSSPSGPFSIDIPGWGLVSANVTNGVGVFSAAAGSASPFFPPGDHTATATFDASGSYETSTSQPVTFTVLSERASTQTALSLSPNPVTAGQATQVAVIVNSTVPGHVPTGMVLLTANGHALAEVPLAGGAATYSFVPPAAGSYVITASYIGDRTAAPSTSTAMLTAAVPPPAPTTTTVSAWPAIALPGAPVTLTATVTAAGGSPTGVVTFFDRGRALGAGLVTDGVAQTMVTFPAGTHSITATYGGDADFLSSASATPFEVTVIAPAVSTATSLTGAPSAAEEGDPVELTANVSAVLPALARSSDPIPTGTVEFLEGTTSLGTATLDDGTASLTLTSLAPGTHRITARYPGGDGFEASESEDPFTVTITARPMSIASRTTVSASPDRAEAGSEVALVAHVSTSPVERPAPASARAADASAPTGSVEFFADGASVGTASLSDGTATLKTSSLAVGTHRITAAYRGDGVFASSESDQAATVTVVAKPSVKPTPTPTPKPTAKPGATTTPSKTPVAKLATTGADPTGSIVLGGILLAAGSALTLIHARRRAAGAARATAQ